MSTSKSLPYSAEDKKISKEHLKMTKKLIKQKIKDHKKAKKAADNPKSTAYHQDHIVGHEKEYDNVVAHWRKVMKVKPKGDKK